MSTAENNQEKGDAFDFPWEDSLIFAFRDTQWKLSIDSALEIKQNIPVKNIEKLYPPPIFKLDGNSETASSDILTLHKERFFLFEFKATREKTISDAKKPIWEFLDKVKCEEANEEFIRISRRSHHFVYATLNDTQKLHSGVSSRFGELKSVIYYDEVQDKREDLRAKQQKEKISQAKDELAKATGYDKKNLEYKLKTEESSLADIISECKDELEKTNNVLLGHDLPIEETVTFEIMKDQRYGTCFEDMFVYLEILKEATSGDKRTPIKCVLSTKQGIVWPLFSLNDISIACNIFSNALEKCADLKNRCHARLDVFSDFKKKYKLGTALKI